MDYLFTQLETEYDLKTATGKRQYSDRLASNLRRLGDPVERDHYVKLMADKLGISEEAVRDKLEKGEKAAAPRRTPATAELALPRSDSPRDAGVGIGPATRSAPQIKPAKQLLEESVLGLNLAYPEVRLSLEDLTPAHFSDADHQLIFEALQRAGDAAVEAVASRLPNQSDYVKILALRGEEEYGSFAPADRSFEAFQLVGRLQTATNKDTKTKLSTKLREAEAKGDTELAGRLLAQYQSLISEEE